MNLWTILPVAGVLLALGGLASGLPTAMQAHPALTTTPSSTPDTATPTTTPTTGPMLTGSATPTVTATGTATAPALTYPIPAWHPVTPPPGYSYSIAAAASDDVWTTGDWFAHEENFTWQVIPHPTPPGGTSGVKLPTVGAPNSIWATTYYGQDNCILHWDGSAWHLMHCPPPAGSVGLYEDAAAFDADNAYFIAHTTSFTTTTVIHCTAQTCESIYSYNASPRLHGVSAATMTDIWAVGSVCPDLSSSCNNPTSYAIHIVNGVATPVSMPNVGILYDVAALAPADVWAGGTNGMLHWDGAAWTTVPGNVSAYKFAVINANDIWAENGSLLHWDGTHWASVSGFQENSIDDIAAVGPSNVWTLGVRFNGPAMYRMIEHYAALPTFRDVPAGSTFAPYVEWLAGHALIGGYSCAGGEPCDIYGRPYYRPAASVSRAQTVKIVTGAAGWALLNPASATFADVAPGSTFYPYIETAAAHGVITGYACGGPGEPCDGQQRPYFRPGAPVSRGQMSKIIALARDYTLPNPASPTFADVAVGSTFYPYVEAVAAQSIVSGYACGTVPDEPCDAQHRPYFRPSAGASRGQVSKFVTLAYAGP